jgi:hypothetical protein
VKFLVTYYETLLKLHSSAAGVWVNLPVTKLFAAVIVAGAEILARRHAITS